ncbi:MAG TPA: hypothetical protein VJH92_05140, partial [Candidatus Nanoarchaeia archaeon]|nr:hypothetical protein [Candidatus Nanoarchaeia archaeon]
MEKIEYNKELSKIIVAIAIIQVLLMINTSVAESYTINKTNEVVQEKIIENKIKKESMNYGLKLLVLLLAIKQIGIVSAVDVQGVCCPQTKNGAICQDILSTDTVSCAIDTVPTECKAYAPCKLGCCVDPTRGSCDERTTQESCLEMRGNWKEGEDCLIQECQKGCCMSTRSNSFINEKECKYASEREGLQEDFRDVETQIECLALFATNEEGACLMEDNACIRTDGNDCLSKGGSFAAGFLCSHPQLNTSCTRQNYTGCDPEGILDGIYWYDSCRNRENIYDSNKDRSWNDGKILKQQESCDPNEGNINDKNCGNCQRAESSICSSSSGSNKIKDGNFICKDLRCYDAESNKWRQNGESWCMYDGYIGNGRDTVGSEHWLSKCIDGEISKPYEMCGDGARSGICVEEKISDGAYTRSTASCIVNTATECLTNQFYKNDSEGGQTRAEVISLADQNDVDISNILLNGDETRYNWDGIKNCMKNNQCMIKKTGIGSSFNFALCLPQYPKGANLTDGIDDNLCAIGNLLPCTVVERKKGFGSWDCVENCECKTKAFAEKMNNICTSVGDCGSYVNYMGEGTDNYNVKGDSVLAWAFKCKSLEKVINLCEIECVGGGSIGSSCSGNKPQGFNDFILSYYEEMCKDEIHGYCQNGEYFIRDSIRVKWQDYKSYADVKKGQYASPPNFTEELQS